MFDTAIRNGSLVTPDRVCKANLYITDGKIAAISDQPLPARTDIDATGRLVFPGMLDTHCHLNDPGFTWREDLEHGSAAAAVGGVTTIIDMPLQNEPALSSAAIYAAKEEALKGRGVVDYAFWGALINNLDELEGLNQAGAVAYKAFIGPVSPDYSSIDMGHARRALKIIKKFNGMAGFHCEDYSVIKACEAEAKETGQDTRAGFFTTRPLVAELMATQNILELARESGTRVHICHVSHPDVAEAIRKAKAEGVQVSAETCPHYLVFTEDDLISKGTLFKCAPPLRRAADRDRLWDYVVDGTLSCLGSDHSPCRADEKDETSRGVLGAWGGISGVQTLMQVFFDQAVTRRGLSPCLLARTSAAAAKAFSLSGRKGALEVGLDADIVLLDPQRAWEITTESLQYLNPISAFVGLKGKGLPVCTLVRGVVVAREGRVEAPAGHGSLVRRDV